MAILHPPIGPPVESQLSGPFGGSRLLDICRNSPSKLFRRIESDTAIGLRNCHKLISLRYQVHLDAPFAFVVVGQMTKRTEVKIGSQLAIDSRQQIQIERSGDTRRIVVGREKQFNWFHKIGAEQ